MNDFLSSEKPNQVTFKLTSPTISPEALVDGIYKGKPYPFCLPSEFAEENLFPGIRSEAMTFFAKLGIHWHDGQNGKPSNHLCDSQVCCVNFLFPFVDKPSALKHILLPVFPEIECMLPVESGRFVSFEWIGAKNYLGERMPATGGRSRGANCTSADAIVLFERTDGLRQAVLIEWKYTESYGGNNMKVSKGGTDRTAIYRSLYEAEDCPLRKELIPSFEALFYEPFYQFMRQQFLAYEMEKAHELGADMVNVLHISPAKNLGFRKITSPGLAHLGETATGVWSKIACGSGLTLHGGERFQAVHAEDLFGGITTKRFPELAAWAEYIRTRYAWTN